MCEIVTASVAVRVSASVRASEMRPRMVDRHSEWGAYHVNKVCVRAIQ